MILLRCHTRLKHLTKTTQVSPQYTYGQPQPNLWTSQNTGYTATSQYPAQAATSPYGAHPSTSQGQLYERSNTLPTSLHTGPAENITDIDLYQKGARARGRIKGTEGTVEELDAGK